jgi:hypothetical protein
MLEIMCNFLLSVMQLGLYLVKEFNVVLVSSLDRLVVVFLVRRNEAKAQPLGVTPQRSLSAIVEQKRPGGFH